MLKKVMLTAFLLGHIFLAYSMEENRSDILSELPIELKQQILKILTSKEYNINALIKNIVGLRKANKIWREHIDSSYFWKNIFYDFFNKIKSEADLEDQIELSDKIISKKLIDSEFLYTIRTELSNIIERINEDKHLSTQMSKCLDNVEYEQAKNLLNELKKRKPIKLILDSLLPEIADKLSITCRADFRQLASYCQEFEEIIQNLINLGVEVNARNGWGGTALISFASLLRVENISHNMIPYNYRSRNEFTEIYKEIISCFDNIVKRLLENGADVNAQSSSGDTALIGASRNGHINIVKTLLNIGFADVNIKNPMKETALMNAASAGNIEIVQILIDKGADVKIKNDRNETALTIAKKGAQKGIINYIRIVEILKAAGAV